jgi:spermidine synthase
MSGKPLSRVAPLLLGSGMCSLIYQTVWLREFRLIFGASTASTAAVLGIFMGGLGLGSLLLGGRSEKWKNPLRAYALMEMGIAAFAAASPFLLLAARRVTVECGGSFALGPVSGTALRLLLAALVLVVPTALMGGTLPAVARAVSGESDAGRKGLSLLYGTNTLGAVLGTLLSTFVMIECFGIRTTLWIACAANAAVAVAAFGLARKMPGPEDAGEMPGDGRSAAAPAGLVYFAAAAAGFAFLLLELVWYRMLAPLLGGSTFTFGVILAVALAGVGVGGLAQSVLGGGRQSTVSGFALVSALEALAVAMPFAAGDSIAIFAMQVRSLGGFGFPGQVAGWMAVAGLVVFPASFMAGVQFPMLISLLGRGGRGVGRETGAAYGANTFGAIAGSLAGGFGFLPLLGAPGAWRAAAVLLAGVSLLFAWIQPGRRTLLPAFAALAAVALCIGFPGPTAAWRHAAIGIGRDRVQGDTPFDVEQFLRYFRRVTTWEKEGVESSIALRDTNGLAFVVNGKVDGNVISDRSTQVMGALSGFFFRPEAKSVLVIGLGTGSSAGWAGAVPSVERVDVVELEPAILEVARRCADVNCRVLENPKVKVHIGDGREYLLVNGPSYDIIFSEPSNPYRAGIANLFTREFFQAAERRLNRDGIFIQWLQTYDIGADGILSTFATLKSVFPHVEVWMSNPSDLFFVASAAPAAPDADRIREMMAREPWKQAARFAWDASSAEEILARHLVSDAVSASIAADYPGWINTDDRPLMEFVFAKGGGRGVKFSHLNRLCDRGKRLGGLLPSVTGRVDWEAVRLHRYLRMPFLHAVDPPGDEALRKRLELSEMAKQNRAREVVRIWGEIGEPRPSTFDAPRIAAAFADCGVAWPESLDASLSEGDRSALLALLAHARKDPVAAIGDFARACSAYRASPFHSQDIVERALGLAPALAEFAEETLAERIVGALSEPFSGHAAEEQRISAILHCAMVAKHQAGAEKIGAMALAELRKMEPDVALADETLNLRVRLYRRDPADPLLARAAKDLAGFLREQRGAWPAPSGPGEAAAGNAGEGGGGAIRP